MSNAIVGNQVKLTGTFRNASGVLFDPTDLRIQLRYPSGAIGSVNSADINHESVGVFSTVIGVDFAGDWHYRFSCTLPVKCSSAAEFIVDSDGFQG